MIRPLDVLGALVLLAAIVGGTVLLGWLATAPADQPRTLTTYKERFSREH